MGFLPWKDSYHNMLLEQLAIGEAVKGVKAAERARTCRAAGVSAGAGPGSLMVSDVQECGVPCRSPVISCSCSSRLCVRRHVHGQQLRVSHTDIVNSSSLAIACDA
jgi:hypothetical protein